ncbi:hypothetical protein PARSHIK_91 [Erwinia phage vB_EamM_Parshik]|uniref:Uncharacterized protein n=1 Tax=Erwinia phage vB_EamM_Huxley TaxID=1883373 RepID=A0A1B2ID67_9CAUD|nr:polymerase [Erwinia phage vB_EamM_Huxley]ANZ49172.1 hypothetical protein HUXLEY_90 [Erwinia phage vB_EamM_Huxley]ANZ50000.1 hypothetical protein PARSHIK_91 [Erwinia phage vB_EamM_Parshik]
MFADAIKELKASGKIVPFNRAVAEGVGYAQAKDGIHERVYGILKRELTYDAETNPRLPIGLAVQQYRFMSPFEAFIFKVAKADNRQARGRAPVSIARTDQYMIMANIRIPGENRLTARPMYLPFIRRGGLMYSWGTLYHVAPVIHQPGICREHGGIFINFDFTRKVSLKFCKHSVKILVNGKKEEIFLPGTSNLYVPKTTQGQDSDEKPLLYWLFGKYGFKEAVERYTGARVAIWPSYNLKSIDLDKYVVVQSGEPQLGKNIQYAIVVRREDLPSTEKSRWDQNEHMLLAMCAAFYKAAHFYAGRRTGRSQQRNALAPLFTSINEFDVDGDIANLNSKDIWKEILGRSIQGTKPSDVDLLRSMNSHFMECERYVNNTFRAELMAVDPDIDPEMDMFDFLYYTTKMMVRTRLTKQDDFSSMYGKRLTVTDYLLLAPKGFTSTISNIRWRLSQLENRTAESCHETIRDELNKKIVPNLVCRGITSNGGINFFNASTESMVLAVSTHAIGQTETDSKRGKKGKTVNLNDRTKHASASHLECGNVHFIPKSAPFKSNILNAYMVTSRQLVMMRNPKLKKEIEAAEIDIAQIGR